MRLKRLPLVLLLASFACAKPDSAGAPAGSNPGGAETYTAANGDPLKFEFKSAGVVAMDGGPMGQATGTYTAEGEKLLVTMNERTYTFIKDGSCIEDSQQIFGKLCIGGQAGAASNVSTRSAPAVTGSWKATSSDGEFTLEFKGDNKLTLTVTAPGGAPSSKEGTFVVDGDIVQVTLDQSEPLTLKWVNDGYETTSFGFAMRFVRS